MTHIDKICTWCTSKRIFIYYYLLCSPEPNSELAALKVSLVFSATKQRKSMKISHILISNHAKSYPIFQIKTNRNTKRKTLNLQNQKNTDFEESIPKACSLANTPEGQIVNVKKQNHTARKQISTGFGLYIAFAVGGGNLKIWGK